MNFSFPTRFSLVVLASFLAASFDAQSQLSTNKYAQSVNTTIPDDNPNGLSSNIQIAGSSGSIVSIRVNLDMTGGFNGDYYACLVAPSNDFAVLPSRGSWSHATRSRKRLPLNPENYSTLNLQLRTPK